MKFRGVMSEAGAMREFTNIMWTISKLSKECVLRLSDSNLYLVVSEDGCGPTPPVLWCVIPQRLFFTEYDMVGLDEDHKDIYLGFCTMKLARSLSTLKTAKAVKIKLSNQPGPCLTVDIEGASPVNPLETRHMIHDIPVTLIHRKLWSEFQEPRLPQTDISIEMPSLKQVRATVDRMKCVAPDITIRASSEGRLTLQIKTDMAKVSSRFRELKVVSFNGPVEHSDSEDTQHDRATSCHCRIDAKKLSMFLSAEQVAHTRTVCGIVHKTLVILSLETQEGVKLQCFIPGNDT